MKQLNTRVAVVAILSVVILSVLGNFVHRFLPNRGLPLALEVVLGLGVVALVAVCLWYLLLRPGYRSIGDSFVEPTRAFLGEQGFQVEWEGLGLTGPQLAMRRSLDGVSVGFFLGSRAVVRDSVRVAGGPFPGLGTPVRPSWWFHLSGTMADGRALVPFALGRRHKDTETLVKLLGLRSWGLEQMETGDVEFDRAFELLAADRETAGRLFDQETRGRILELSSAHYYDNLVLGVAPVDPGRMLFIGPLPGEGRDTAELLADLVRGAVSE